jgi:argininosuccinate lyase
LIGPAGKKLHTGRSRNDQIALDERLYLRDECHWFILAINKAISSLIRLAGANLDAVMPGYTHLQRAQPILFSHWCLAYVEMLFRDRRRFCFCLGSLSENPLGAAALAGSPLPLDRAFVAKELGFTGVTANSLDTVSDRDYCLDFAFALSVTMAHLSRLGEDIALYASQEFGFLKLDDSFATGSSLMPQKKNPDVAELLRGRAGRAYGLLVQLLTLVKGQPLAYNRDMQEDKELLFSTTDIAAGCLEITPALLAALSLDKKKMSQACEKGFLDATDAADFLVRRGVPFRQAHEAVGKAVKFCATRGLNLSELSENEWKRMHPKFDSSVKRHLGAKASTMARTTLGGTAPSRVRQALRNALERLKKGY